ncbi:MAG TPA: 16S rRNA (adenine(1518)-N(6)/adenine(1519)-N(6))-dimethyltransferase RsmA [Solirubrobacteraceae bacterium]|nr:16S rRNA (adenine(1518)-N(6)/adenine(1519)-N(6))-dimethyltransferase RsmA [Solirubrobacteraceae bacterium]
MSRSGAAPAQPSLRRLQRFGVRPDRELGQNFLIDSNILGVIGRQAALRASDTVLEVGGGLGVLSEYLADRVAHLHVVEVDERLREALQDALAGRTNVSLWWADAMRLDLDALEPPPVKVVANLPYGIAAGFVLRSIEELPGVGLWVVMVQREVGERLAAGPGTAAYGVPSVLAQLACGVRVVRAIPRSVFYPAPNVDSVLVRLERRADPHAAPGGRAEPRDLRALVAAGFAHRRKTLAGSLRLVAGADGSPGWERERVQQALASIGLAPDVRAERISPEQFLELARALEP